MCGNGEPKLETVGEQLLTFRTTGPLSNLTLVSTPSWDNTLKLEVGMTLICLKLETTI